MKNIITAMALSTIIFFNISFAIAHKTTGEVTPIPESKVTSVLIVTPAPEVIACESEGSCEMTTLAILLQRDQEEQMAIEKQQAENVKKNFVSK
jgi:hypothetical protein